MDHLKGSYCNWEPLQFNPPPHLRTFLVLFHLSMSLDSLFSVVRPNSSQQSPKFSLLDGIRRWHIILSFFSGFKGYDIQLVISQRMLSPRFSDLFKSYTSSLTEIATQFLKRFHDARLFRSTNTALLDNFDIPEFFQHTTCLRKVHHV